MALALGVASCASALNIELLGDVNYDGLVNSKDADVKREDPHKRAFFLANIGDKDSSCRDLLLNQEITASQFFECNDANDEDPRNPAHFAPALLSPCEDLSPEAYGQVITDHINVRVFHSVGEDAWIYVDPSYKFTHEQLMEGVMLGIDSRDVRRPSWDGKTTLKFRVQDGEAYAEDFVEFQVAPVLTPHVLQAPLRVYTMKAPSEYPDQQEFVTQLQSFTTAAGATDPVHQFEPNKDSCTPDEHGRNSLGQDVWVQDFFKPGYTSMPGLGGATSLHIMITSAQDRPDAHQQIFEKLRSDNVGAVRPAGNGQTLDSLGNLDTIPPFTNQGVAYPAGMPIMGVDGQHKPHMLEFLAAQGTPALEIDSGWLLTAHIDEFIQFLPDPNEDNSWLMAANDPIAGLNLFKDTRNRGYGNFNAFSRKGMEYDCLNDQEEPSVEPSDSSDSSESSESSDSDSDEDEDKGKGGGKSKSKSKSKSKGKGKGQGGGNSGNSGKPNMIGKLLNELTIEKMLDDPDLEPFNKFCASRIEDGIKRIVAVTGISPDRIIRIPTLYHGHKQEYPRAVMDQDGSSAEIMAGAKRMVEPEAESKSEPDYSNVSHLKARTVFPNAINGLVYNKQHCLSPLVWGPEIEGVDILQHAVNKAYNDAGIQIQSIDDWSSHYQLNGDIHCGTNIARDDSQPWWPQTEPTA